MPTTGDPVIALPEWELQQDIYAILNADSTIKTTYAANVYDEVPEGATGNYLVVGDVNSNPMYHKSGALDDITALIHIYVFPPNRGFKLVLQLASAISSALTGGSYSLTGFTVRMVSRDNLVTFREQFDQDRTLRRGALYMKYLIQ